VHPVQLAILGLVFIVAAAGVFGFASLMVPSAARQRLGMLVGDEARSPRIAGRWLQRVADWTRPISKLSGGESLGSLKPKSLGMKV
jgi:hypothetical protein